MERPPGLYGLREIGRPGLYGEIGRPVYNAPYVQKTGYNSNFIFGLSAVSFVLVIIILIIVCVIIHSSSGGSSTPTPKIQIDKICTKYRNRDYSDPDDGCCMLTDKGTWCNFPQGCLQSYFPFCVRGKCDIDFNDFDFLQKTCGYAEKCYCLDTGIKDPWNPRPCSTCKKPAPEWYAFLTDTYDNTGSTFPTAPPKAL